MKSKRIGKKLSLKFETIAALNQSKVMGGLSIDCPVDTDECGGGTYTCNNCNVTNNCGGGGTYKCPTKDVFFFPDCDRP